MRERFSFSAESAEKPMILRSGYLSPSDAIDVDCVGDP
jgi:hypothetical protein